MGRDLPRVLPYLPVVASAAVGITATYYRYLPSFCICERLLITVPTLTAPIQALVTAGTCTMVRMMKGSILLSDINGRCESWSHQITILRSVRRFAHRRRRATACFVV